MAEKKAYSGGEDKPLAAYTGLMALYGGYAGAVGLLAWRRGLPERVPARDLALLAAATYKTSRLLTRDKVTSPLRAPFTRVEPGAGEVDETPAGTGARKAVGELLTCPFCVSQWLATGFLGALLVAPRPTRFVTSLLTAVTASDALQWGMAALRKRAED